jgi:hypothetical protein
MQVSLQHVDGTEDTREVTSLSVWVNGEEVEITPRQSPARLCLRGACGETRHVAFVIHPGAANLVEVEVRVEENRPELT